MQRTDCWLPEGRGLGRLGEKGEGIEKYKRGHRGVKYSPGNTVSNVVVTVVSGPGTTGGSTL